ncbi:MAG TPA: hypothetical protein VGR11_11220 [Solirubrobacteraceae bacterium]|nr:hypothetical protein [Solirubrobacteraceae bacterium]
MDLLAAWLLYPLALALLCLGLGLLAGRLAGWRFPGVMLLPVGFVTLVALARLLTQEGATARFALPVLVVLALAGLLVQRAWLRSLRPDPWIALAAVGVFAIFGAPIILSGEPTFAGYLALPDTSHQLSLADLVAQHGFDWAPIDEGSRRLSLHTYVLTAYPVGGQAALGVTAPLGVLDLAWLYQPLLSFMAAMTSLALAGLVAPLLRSRLQVGLAAFVAAQPALVVGFALQGSIKEITAIASVITGVAVLAVAIRERRPARSLLVLAIAGAAALGALGPAAGAFYGVVVLVVLVVWGVWIARAQRWREVGWLVACGAFAMVLALPVLTSLATQLHVQGGTLEAQDSGGAGAVAVPDVGNLAQPLGIEQVLGVWLEGDYRYETIQYATLQTGALWLAGICALLGLSWSIRRRAWQPLLLVVVLVAPSIYLLGRGSPYADAKVLAILSPAILLLAILGALVLWRGRWRPLSLLLAGALTLAVVSSSALAYHDVSLTPYDRYAELLELNERLAGRGPVIFNEYDEFGKYFLRDASSYNEPEWPHGYRHEPYEPNALADPKRRPSMKTPLDVDDLRLDYLQSAPYIILRRSPTASRPPANFRLAWSGDFYELWRRTAAPRVVRHKPLGPDILHPAARVTAAEARDWAREARQAGGRIAFVERAALTSFHVSHHPRPPTWQGFVSFPEALVPAGPGLVDAPVRIPRSGRYHVWFEGSFARPLTVSVDNRPLGTTHGGLNNPGAYVHLGTRQLTHGVHGVQVRQGGGDLTPGSGGYRSSLRHIGPILFQPVRDAKRRVRVIDPDDWRELVGVRADWLEVVR